MINVSPRCIGINDIYPAETVYTLWMDFWIDFHNDDILQCAGHWYRENGAGPMGRHTKLGGPDFGSHFYCADSGSISDTMVELFWLHFYRKEGTGARTSMFSTVDGLLIKSSIKKYIKASEGMRDCF